MKERPILFSAPMVRAILEGRKTQTRRVVKPQPSQELLDDYAEIRRERNVQKDDAEMLSECLPCPYGVPGDRLWVRETWARDDEDGALMYRADVGCDDDANAWERGRIEGVSRYRWRPSIHMPRWASRITLEITDVRVERLQEISEADARAEGVYPYMPGEGVIHPPRFADDYQYRPNYREGFEIVWQSIHGDGSWAANPWVWVIGFKREAA